MAFGEDVEIIQQPAQQNISPQTPQSQNQPNQSSTLQQSNNSSSQCPTEDAIKGYLVSQNLATYKILAIIPSKAVPGYCDVILKNMDNKTFFMRIRSDMAYIIAGNVINAITNEVQKPDMSKYTNQQNSTQPSSP
ncbi:hypothetical protein JCM8795_10110 [Hydrogenobaculum acidophilum]